MKARYLSLEDVIAVGMTLDDAVRIVEASFTEHAEKQVQNPPKLPIHPMPDAFINAMPSFLPRKGACGMKWVSGFPSNVPKGIPSIYGMIILNDVDTGMPIAVMDGTYITAMRTVAVSAAAAKRLCNSDATTMALVGCGLQGRLHTIAMKAVVPSLTSIRVCDAYEPAVESYMSEMRERLPEVSFEVGASPEDVIREADLVLTATGKLLEPIFNHEWVGEGALVLPIHTQGWDSAIASSMDKLIVDDWAQFRTVGDKIYQPLPEGPHAETGEIIAGLKPGREQHSERIVNFNKGISIHDILMAKEVLDMATGKGIGSELTLQNPDTQLPVLEG